MKRIYIVTGANGFLGNNIIRKLEQDDNNEIEIGKEFLSMIVYKEENFAQRIFNKIRKLFSRKKEMYE